MLTGSTPQKTASTTVTTPGTRSSLTTSTTPGSSSSHLYRLLYRGALSLPDSYLLLDGLTFSAHLESPKKHQLLDNPLALALESMRGRQSLQFLGTVNLSDVWFDESGNVELDIHPRATLSKIYFENIFCLSPYPAASTSQQTTESDHGMRSELGVKIALGDADGPDTTHIIVFGQVTAPKTVRLRVARLTSRPLPRQTISRMPRPDDPTPRKPPVTFGRTKSVGAGNLSRDLKRTASSSNGVSAPGGPITKKQKLTGPAREPSRSGSIASLEDQIFKVPPLPGKAKGKGKEDVFGSVLKKNASFSEGDSEHLGEIERANKNLIKTTALEQLSKMKDSALRRNVGKTHPEFKDIWGWIYRGVGFALRAHMKVTPLHKNHMIPTSTSQNNFVLNYYWITQV
ncbi:hypothetical protein Agabi119p4_2154 [Agaricus bisporus var. burnettii]|uniref:Sld7 C-terminal domain-containing protein n=1 Tax=Agaricus bisporus var. burnettii TaxID=192524 RepID=A0A8H7KJZ9_AGABI|nr:hypothetical protein Agabi119p4_2154 [Agaricus bisporus var. burnettii]